MFFTWASRSVTPDASIISFMCFSTSIGWYQGTPPCAFGVTSWARNTLWNHLMVSPGTCVGMSSSYSHSTITIVPNFSVSGRMLSL